MSREKVLEAILTIVAGLLFFYFLLNVSILLYLAFALAVIGIVSGFLAGKIVWLWFKLSKALGFISSRILLSVIFYFVLLPLSLLYRLFHKDNLMLDKKNKITFFVERDHQYTSDDLKNPW